MSKQHHKPCKECPFRRGCLPGYLGGSAPEVFVGQAHGNFWLPCHLHSNYEDPDWASDTSKPQCAGAAIYRANTSKRTPPQLLTLPKDNDAVFSSPVEFLAHHKGIDEEQVIAELAKKDVMQHMIEEYNKVFDEGKGWVGIT